jgi:hypothetical protein
MIIDIQQHPHVVKSGGKSPSKSWFYDQAKDSMTKAKLNQSGKTKKTQSPAYNSKSKPIAVTKCPSSGSIPINNGGQLKSHLLVGYDIQHQMALAAQVQYHKARLARGGGPEMQAQARPKAFTPPNTQSIIHARNVLMRNGGGKGGEYYAGAKFDSVPSIAVLPSPPVQWTDSALRSQSQPSSPIPKMMQQEQKQNSSSTGSQFAIDLASLFGARVVISEHHVPQVKVGC